MILIVYQKNINKQHFSYHSIDYLFIFYYLKNAIESFVFYISTKSRVKETFGLIFITDNTLFSVLCNIWCHWEKTAETLSIY